MDDVVAVGPPRAVFTAVRRFQEALRPSSLRVQPAKCGWVMDEDARAAHDANALPGCTVAELAAGSDDDDAFTRGMMRDEEGNECFGIAVYGVPVGSPEYVTAFLDDKCVVVMGNLKKVTMLSHQHIQYFSCHWRCRRVTLTFGAGHCRWC